MVNKFTKKFIDSLKPEAKDYWKREGNGFCIRVLPSGIRIWYFIFTFEGRKRYMLLGNYPEVSIEDARERSADARKILKNGADPLSESNQAKVERLRAFTIKDLGTDYLEKYAKINKKSWQEDERMLNKEVIPAWGKVKAVDIKRADLVILLKKVADRGAPVMANRLRALLLKMFNYAVTEDIIEFSPCTKIAPTEESARERALSEEEIKILFSNLDNADIIMSPEIKRALKLILVTGQRPGEVIGMHAKEIQGRWWTIPKARTKTNRTHRVYLTDLAVELIGDLKGRTYLFPSPPTAKEPEKDQPIGEKAMACSLRRNIKGQIYGRKGKRKLIKEEPANLNRLGVEHFTPHDLRRTAVGLMSKCGVEYEHRERVLNHSIGKMDKIYNQYDFDAEKQRALQTLSDKITEICAPPRRPHYRIVDGRREVIIYE